jgi:hypothetical protein
MGDCKCGQCRLVERPQLDAAADLITRQAASLREAREAMEGVAEIAVTSTGPGYAAIFHRARAWLAKTEKTDAE